MGHRLVGQNTAHLSLHLEGSRPDRCLVQTGQANDPKQRTIIKTLQTYQCRKNVNAAHNTLFRLGNLRNSISSACHPMLRLIERIDDKGSDLFSNEWDADILEPPPTSQFGRGIMSRSLSREEPGKEVAIWPAGKIENL